MKGLPFDLHQEVSKLSVEAVAGGSVSGDACMRDLMLERLTVLDHIIRIAQGQVSDLVHDLRDLPVHQRAKWTEIAKALSINSDAAMKRFTTAPKARMDKPGYSMSEAAALLGLSRATVHNKVVSAGAKAKWLARVSTNGSVVKSTYRILDLEALAAAPTNWAINRGSEE
ncbi:hypothetical protein ACFY9N_05775 [Microbacterium sp. NPDC008134]|uniref:hypothetical protein n=1 Tax=Microbacterium sp. NPDC008134 TaxID=3364183 RepID=UPI0036E9BAA8